MNIEILKSIVEAMVMVSDSPITAEKLCQTIDELNVKPADIKEAIAELHNDYQDRGIELVEVASGYRFQAAAKYQPWFHRLLQEKPPKYSKALLETLAIIAYRQPVTRADVESIRGVAVSSSIIKTLLERDWIRVVGQRDVPGKPSIYATTKDFLDYFGLIALSELPPITEIKQLSDLVKSHPEAVEANADNENQTSDDIEEHETDGQTTVEAASEDNQTSTLAVSPEMEAVEVQDNTERFDQDVLAHLEAKQVSSENEDEEIPEDVQSTQN